jgi:Chaperone of endosialidase
MFPLVASAADGTGIDNTALGAGALQGMTDGGSNTAIGAGTLQATLNAGCTAIGWHAGATGSGIGNIYIGANVDGPANESGVTRIGNIYLTAAGGGRAVYVTSDNRLGTLESSRRYKDEIKPMAEASEAIFSLNPVSFRYKKELDPARCLSFGLIAEEVAQIDPNLVTPDRDGNPETVRYEAVNAMLLNEFLKEHRKVEQLTKEFESKFAQQQKQIETLTAGLQKVSAQLELHKPAPQTVLNSQ